jgi:hypothetical protein
VVKKHELVFAARKDVISDKQKIFFVQIEGEGFLKGTGLFREERNDTC